MGNDSRRALKRVGEKHRDRNRSSSVHPTPSSESSARHSPQLTGIRKDPVQECYAHPSSCPPDPARLPSDTPSSELSERSRCRLPVPQTNERRSWPDLTATDRRRRMFHHSPLPTCRD